MMLDVGSDKPCLTGRFAKKLIPLTLNLLDFVCR
jgi:hypothetical protein